MADGWDVLAKGTVDTTDEQVFSMTGDGVVDVVVHVPASGSTVSGIILRCNGTGTADIIAECSSLAVGETWAVRGITLGNADTLRLQSTSGDDVANYFVLGVQES